VLWIGLFVSELGFQFTLVATYVQVTGLTSSAAAVGVIGLVGFGGLVAGSLVGASFLDAVDRRKILIWSQFGFMAAAGLLLAGAVQGHPPLGQIYAAVALLAFVSAIEGPTRSAMTPRLVGRELVPSALALNQVIWNATGLAGPAITVWSSQGGAVVGVRTIWSRTSRCSRPRSWSARCRPSATRAPTTLGVPRAPRPGGPR
jgi:MFS family permease